MLAPGEVDTVLYKVAGRHFRRYRDPVSQPLPSSFGKHRLPFPLFSEAR